MWIVMVLATAGLAASSGPTHTVFVEGLERSCRSLAGEEFTRCRIERRHGRWSLTTHVVANGGSRARVAALEERFCRAARHIGVIGDVTRWQKIFGVRGGSAKAEWRCTPLYVSVSPPARGVLRH